MARRSRIKMDDDETELNMTPMLDVVFILLIFFIVTSVFVKTPGIDPSKPTASTSAEWKPSILIGVNAANEIWIDKRPYDVDEIRPIRLLRRRRRQRLSVSKPQNHKSVSLHLKALFLSLKRQKLTVRVLKSPYPIVTHSLWCVSPQSCRPVLKNQVTAAYVLT